MHKIMPFYFLLFLFGCKNKQVNLKPTLSAITESVYAAGVLKSQEQYQAFSNANGTIKTIYVKEGDSVKKGMPILSITNDLQQLNTQNALLSARYADLSNNQGKLDDARNLISLRLRKMKNDSLMAKRQQNIWQNNVGTKVELEQREFTYQVAKVDYQSAIVKFNILKKQIDFSALQSKKNLQISQKLASDFTLKSEVNGILYHLYKKRGEWVTQQTPLALLGGNKQFVLEMQVDEYDIFKVRRNQLVLVTLDSYKGKVFESRISSISPMMNQVTKTFLVEAVFVDPPKTLYPFISFEANIIIHTKPKTLLIPINYLVNDSTVLKSNGKMVKVKTGLKDYKMVEILNGITVADELTNPIK